MRGETIVTANQMIEELRRLHPNTLLIIKTEDNLGFTPVDAIRDSSGTELFEASAENPRPVAIVAICDTHMRKEHDAVAKALERLGYAPTEQPQA